MKLSPIVVKIYQVGVDQVPDVVVSETARLGSVDALDREIEGFDLILLDVVLELFLNFSRDCVYGGLSWFNVAAGRDPVFSLDVMTKIDFASFLVVGHEEDVVVMVVAFTLSVDGVICVELIEAGGSVLINLGKTGDCSN